jgi:endonuclease/exonuclease/phosphatase family metal-dependent hydrolase
MSARGLLLLAFVAAVFAPRAGAAAPPRPLRLVTYNVLHGGLGSERCGDGQRLEERLRHATEALQALDADVIGLQEASAGRRRGNVAARLAESLGLEAVFAPATESDGVGLAWRAVSRILGLREGPAILSRFPIAGAWHRRLEPCGRSYPRVLLCADLATPWGPLQACSTHTSGSACHAESVARLLAGRRPDVPLVLLGDLNAVEDSTAMRHFTGHMGLVDAFRRANPEAPGSTVWQPVRDPRRRARRRVDYVLLAPATARVHASRVALDAPARAADGGALWPSDHYAVAADAELW